MRVCVVVAGDPDHRKMERKLPKKISIYRSCLKRTAKVCLYDSRVSNRFLRPHISSVYIKKPRGRVQERLIRRVISTCKALFFVPYVVAAMRETNGFFFFGVWVKWRRSDSNHAICVHFSADREIVFLGLRFCPPLQIAIACNEFDLARDAICVLSRSFSQLKKWFWYCNGKTNVGWFYLCD